MIYDHKEIKTLENNFELLRKLVQQSKSEATAVNLTKIEKLIKIDIPDKLKHNAPFDFHVTYTNFIAAYDSFKNFFLFDKLIGKKVVALGGGFSSGKSSFLNAYMRQSVLPADIDPSTSVPTYIIKGDTHQVEAINLFHAKMNLELPDIRRIAHGFGKCNSESQEQDVVTLGHIIKSIFFSTSLMDFDALAFLDTPGYSKPDNFKKVDITDEIIARNQLNSSQYILWFIQADAGTITEEDINFIKTLRSDIPKLFIISKSDKKTDAELQEINAKVKEVLLIKGISFIDVLNFSNKSIDSYDGLAIVAHLQKWDQQTTDYQFAINFKKLFLSCKIFYEENINQENQKLHHINKVRLLAEDDVIIECFDSLLSDIKTSIDSYRHALKEVKELQQEFFTELKFVSDAAGIMMPEPAEIDLLEESNMDPMKLITQYSESNNITINPKLASIVSNTMSNLTPNLANQINGTITSETLKAIIMRSSPTTTKKINLSLMNSNETIPLLQLRNI